MLWLEKIKNTVDKHSLRDHKLLYATKRHRCWRSFN